VVPPNMAHAFATAPGHSADFLIVLAPGLERFDHFRLDERIRKGGRTLEELLASQELYDNHFLDSPAWWAARAYGSARFRERGVRRNRRDDLDRGKPAVRPFGESSRFQATLRRSLPCYL
jgi:hypothetical protein